MDDFERDIDSIGRDQLVDRFSALSGIRLSERLYAPEAWDEKLFESDIVDITSRYYSCSLLDLFLVCELISCEGRR
jgi:hypothetical protein